MLIADEVQRLHEVASILLPGDDHSPSAGSITDLEQLIVAAAQAIGPEEAALRSAVKALPEELTWDSLKAFSESDPTDFELVSTVAAGAYFMAPAVLTSIGYPQGPRKAPRNDQVVEELETGVLDQVMARESMVREIP